MNGAWTVTIEWPDLVDGQVKQRKILISDLNVQEVLFRSSHPDKDTADQITVLTLAELEVAAGA